MRILLIRRGALGDVIVTIPLLRNLRTIYPQCYIEVAGDRNYWNIAYPYLVNKITCPESLYINSLYLKRPLTDTVSGYYNGFDLIIGFVNDIENIKETLINSDVSRIVLKKPFHDRGHIIDYTNSALDDLPDIQNRVTLPGINIDSNDRKHAQHLLSCFNRYTYLVAIHPRTYGIKGLKLEFYLKLATSLENTIGAKVLWIIGPAEEESIDEIADRYGEQYILRTDNLKMLSAIISEVDLYFGCDTGISHLAAATNVNCVVLFGPTDPHVWGPKGENVKILKYNDPKDLNLNKIKDIIASAIGRGIGIEGIEDIDS